DLADQDVLEPVGALAHDRRALLGEDEVAEEQVVEQPLDVEVRREVLQRTAPEDAADHRATVQQRLLVRRQVVDAGRDQRLKRVRDALGQVLAAALEQHPDRLLDEERVALGLLEQVAARLGGEAVLRQQRLQQLLALVEPQRI